MKRIMALIVSLAMLLSLCACTITQLDTPGDEPSQAPTWQELYDMGVRYLSQGNYAEAILAFTAAIEIDPRQVETYLGLSDVYVAMGNIDKAAQTLYDAIQTQGNNSQLLDALEQLGFTINANGTLQRLDLDRILQDAKRTVDALYAPDIYRSYLTFGELHERLDPIIDRLKIYIENHPSDSQGYYYLGGVYCLLNDMDISLKIRQEGFSKTGDILLTPSSHSRPYEESSVDCDAWGRVTRWEDGLGVPHIYQYGDGVQLIRRIVEHPGERQTSDYFYEDGRVVSVEVNRNGQAGGQSFEWNDIYTYEYQGDNTCTKRHWMVEQERDGSSFDVITFDSYGNTILTRTYDSLSGELKYSIER